MSRWVDMKVKSLEDHVLAMEGDGIEAPLYASVSDVTDDEIRPGDELKVLIDSDDYPLEVHEADGARLWPYPQ